MSSKINFNPQDESDYKTVMAKMFKMESDIEKLKAKVFENGESELSFNSDKVPIGGDFAQLKKEMISHRQKVD